MSSSLVAVPLERWRDPASVFAAGPATAEHAFWLDAGPDAVDGWSWVGTGVPEHDLGRVRRVECATRRDREWPAGRFRGGWVGWLGYEPAAAAAGAPVAASDTRIAPDAWLRVERFVAFDHAARRAWAVAPEGEVHDFARAVDAGRDDAPVVAAAAPTGVAAARHLPQEYAALIERCRAAIREGDAYQLCLTTRFSVDAEIDAAAAFQRLRRMTPAHHGGFVRHGDVALASASPERFLEVEDGTVRTLPIKGTRPRGADEAEDRRLAEELRASEKERAENVMIVDLMRNDLSRVCVPGSVGVDALLVVESYAAVHQLVSTVSGRLREGITVGDLLDAAFPAGSMTGAPKLSAMTILHALEGAPRGVFSGCFGWVGGRRRTRPRDGDQIDRQPSRRRVRRGRGRHHVAIGCRSRGRRGRCEGARPARRPGRDPPARMVSPAVR